MVFGWGDGQAGRAAYELKVEQNTKGPNQIILTFDLSSLKFWLLYEVDGYLGVAHGLSLKIGPCMHGPKTRPKSSP